MSANWCWRVSDTHMKTLLEREVAKFPSRKYTAEWREFSEWGVWRRVTYLCLRDFHKEESVSRRLSYLLIPFLCSIARRNLCGLQRLFSDPLLSNRVCSTHIQRFPSWKPEFDPRELLENFLVSVTSKFLIRRNFFTSVGRRFICMFFIFCWCKRSEIINSELYRK
jgi:hypothetical protein